MSPRLRLRSVALACVDASFRRGLLILKGLICSVAFDCSRSIAQLQPFRPRFRRWQLVVSPFVRHSRATPWKGLWGIGCSVPSAEHKGLESFPAQSVPHRASSEPVVSGNNRSKPLTSLSLLMRSRVSSLPLVVQCLPQLLIEKE